jgi:signal transduction histidine kinase/DNA-binding response OmpR family regulator/PAS domain-containing protein
MGGRLNIDKLKRAELNLRDALQVNEQHNTRLQVEIQGDVDKLQETQCFSDTLFKANPHMNILLDDRGRPMDCNPAVIEYFGFAGKDDLLQNLLPAISRSIPEFQPDGVPSYTFRDRFAQVVQHGIIEFETELVFGGVRAPLHCIMKKLEYLDSFVVAAYLVDMRSLKEARNELMRQGRLLRKVNEVAVKLMASEPEDIGATVKDALGIMALGVGADRMHIWENYTRNGEDCYRRIALWDAAAADSTAKLPNGGFSYNSIPSLHKTLSSNQSINRIVRDMLKDECVPFIPATTQSILLIPVFLHGTFWGFIGLDDSKNERVFSEIEEKILQSSSILIVSSILRNQTTQNLIAAREAALNTSKAKSDFLSNMSHELRTPINAVVGMTLIGKSADDIKKKDVAFDKIEIASAHLLGVINDVLDMSKIEANKFELSPESFLFEKMLQKVVGVVNFRVEEKHQDFFVHIDENIPGTLFGDEQRLAQVITNLLSNAVKFTPERGSVTLKALLLEEENGICTIQVEVADTGIGISAEQQIRLFNPFEQAENKTSRKFGGTGLGLAISKRIVEMMDGRIWVDSELGKGATFSFTVKVRRGEEEHLRHLRPCANWKNIRVLAVDDAPEIRDYFAEVSRTLEFACDTAASGEDACALMGGGCAYDIYFVDWRMPGMDGIELARRIKKHGAEKSVVIMISSTEWSVIEEAAKEAGVSKFLPKPLFPSMIANCITECLGMNSLPEEEGKTDTMEDFSGCHILLAEDVEINREIVLALLEPMNLAIDCAENGVEAVKMFSAAPRKYSMIFMDVQMPEMDGYEATRRIRALEDPYAKEVPIVALTANAFQEDVEKCLRAGMNAHVGKPLDFGEVVEYLRKYLR